MPVGLGNLDVFALVDSDTEEARAFTTYLNYWLCLAEHVEREFPNYDALVAALAATKAFRSLAGKPSRADPREVRSLLLNAWSSELALHLVETTDTKRLWLANQWAQVQSYYATSRMATAWMLTRDATAPQTHRALLRGLSAQVTNSSLIPPPWACCCIATKPKAGYSSFAQVPQVCSPLANAADRWDRLGMLLRTTRERTVTKHVEQLKSDRGLQRAPRGEYVRQDARIEATTVFDFAWRTRTRSNYGDPAMFYVGTLTPERSADFAHAVRVWTSSTMLLFEALVAKKLRSELVDAATHFIARDRAHLADGLLGERLRALGLLGP